MTKFARTTCFSSLLPVLFAVACAEVEPKETGSESSESSGAHDAEVIVVPGADTTAVSVSAVDSQALDTALVAASALGVVFEESSTQDYAADGEYNVLAPPPSACVGAGLDGGDLVLDFSACEDRTGTVRVSWQRSGPTVVTFEGEFSVEGTDIDGQLELSAAVRDATFSVQGDVMVDDANQVTFTAGLTLGGGVGIWGALSVDTELGDTPVASEVYFGTADDPMMWAGGCLCPQSGVMGADAVATVDSVPFDFDWLLSGPGEDNYPTWWLSIEETDVEVAVSVAFHGTCGDQTASVAADDFEVVVALDELQAQVDAACDAEELTDEQCAVLGRVLGSMGESYELDVPASELAAVAEDLLQEGVDGLCGG
jgi:hypothetical protein